MALNLISAIFFCFDRMTILKVSCPYAILYKLCWIFVENLKEIDKL